MDVSRVGIVLSITFNLPFAQIAAASWRPRGRGGDIVLSLAGSDRIAYLHLWPHARPWRLKRTEPMLRALADAPAVAAQLAQALQQAEAARLERCGLLENSHHLLEEGARLGLGEELRPFARRRPGAFLSKRVHKRVQQVSNKG